MTDSLRPEALSPGEVNLQDLKLKELCSFLGFESDRSHGLISTIDNFVAEHRVRRTNPA